VAGLPALRAFHESGNLVISSEIGHRKPHPEFYRNACKRLGLPAAQVLWVGDDAENDVRGPQRAGLRAVLVDRRDASARDFPTISDLQTLAEVLG
jgi:putative hydrolase of the HAD superfamily